MRCLNIHTCDWRNVNKSKRHAHLLTVRQYACVAQYQVRGITGRLINNAKGISYHSHHEFRTLHRTFIPSGRVHVFGSP